MSRNVKVVLNPGAVPELLKSPEILADLERRALNIANAAGGAPDYEIDSSIGRTRARAMVWTATPEARYEEASRRTLTRAVDAGRR